MLLNEPIIKVFELQYKEDLLQEWQNTYLHTIGAFEYHVTEGYWLLLETENNYATIGFDGVQIYKKSYVFPEDKFEWWYNGDAEWIDYKDTLLSGQRIHSVEVREDYKTIYFDDFELRLYVYGKNDEFNVDGGNFGNGNNVMAIGGHLAKKCKCGGSAEILCDERSDYAVRCSVCHTATYFDMILKERIEAWNNGDTPCVIDTGYEKLVCLLTEKKYITYFALSSSDQEFEMYDDTSCDCANIMMAFDDTYFLLSSQKLDSDKYGFTGSIISDYNRDFWENVIRPTDKISFIREEEDYEGRKTLRFRLDDVDLLIEATNRGLSVSLDEVQLHLDFDKIQTKRIIFDKKADEK